MSTRRRPRRRFGQVAQLPSGRWRVRYTTPDGTRRTAPVTFQTRTAAENHLTQVHAELLRGHGMHLMPTTTTVGEYVQQWLDTATHLRPSTAQHYRRVARRWILRRTGSIDLAALPLPNLTVTMVRTWHTELLAATAEAAAPAPPATRAVHPARAWARAQGMDCPTTGRLPQRILTAWAAAGSPSTPTPAPAEPAPARGRTSAAHAYRLLRTIIGQAVRDGLIQHNPVQVKGAATAPHPERIPLTVEEVTALAQATAHRYRAAVLTGAWSGLRPGELFALHRADVDLAAGTITVRRTLLELEDQGTTYGPTKSTAGARTVALPATITAALAEHLATFTGPAPDALVFTTETGHPLTKTARTRIMGAARKSIGRPDVTWHHLRHTGATLAAISGATLAELQHRIGHSTPRAAMIYQHASATRDRRLADALDALISPPQPSTSPTPEPGPAQPPAPPAVPLPAPLEAPEAPAPAAQAPAAAWAAAVDAWARECAAMGMPAGLTDATRNGVAQVVRHGLEDHRPEAVTAAQLTEALHQLPDTAAYTRAREGLGRVLSHLYRSTGRVGDPLAGVPEAAPEDMAAPAPQHDSAPAGYTRRRFGHLSVIEATA